MKIDCPCGSQIFDGTDSLPHKGHMVPDQSWAEIFDHVDTLLDEIKGGKPIADEDYMRLRLGFPDTLTAYQCSTCGRLHIWQGENIFIFDPADGTPKDLFRIRKC